MDKKLLIASALVRRIYYSLRHPVLLARWYGYVPDADADGLHYWRNWIPDLGHWDTIVFLSSMMFAFAGLEVARLPGVPVIPQRDFPRACVSAAVIVGIYMVVRALNTLLPAGKTDIAAGVMQAMHAAAVHCICRG